MADKLKTVPEYTAAVLSQFERVLMREMPKQDCAIAEGKLQHMRERVRDNVSRALQGNKVGPSEIKY